MHFPRFFNLCRAVIFSHSPRSRFAGDRCRSSAGSHRPGCRIFGRFAAACSSARISEAVRRCPRLRSRVGDLSAAPPLPLAALIGARISRKEPRGAVTPPRLFLSVCVASYTFDFSSRCRSRISEAVTVRRCVCDLSQLLPGTRSRPRFLFCSFSRCFLLVLVFVRLAVFRAPCGLSVPSCALSTAEAVPDLPAGAVRPHSSGRHGVPVIYAGTAARNAEPEPPPLPAAPL